MADKIKQLKINLNKDNLSVSFNLDLDNRESFIEAWKGKEDYHVVVDKFNQFCSWRLSEFLTVIIEEVDE